MLTDPNAHLAAEYRRAIYNSFVLSSDFHAEIRATLALITAEYVLPIWDKPYSDNPFPKHILITLEQWLNGFVEDDTIYTLAHNGALYLERFRTSSNRSEPAFFAAGAAVAALFEALGSVLDISEAPQEPEDDEAEARGLGDTAYWALVAYASTPNAFELDPQRCQEFWHWWVTHAIPTACKV